MTVSVLLRIPEDWRTAALYTLRWIGDVGGFTLADAAPGIHEPIATVEYVGGVKSETAPAISTKVWIRIPFLQPVWPPFLDTYRSDDCGVRTIKWLASGAQDYTYSSRISVSGDRALAIWEDSQEPAVTISQTDGRFYLQFGADVIGSAFLCIAEVDMYRIADRDEHGRVPQRETYPVRNGLLQIPTASDSALAVGRALSLACQAAGEPAVMKCLWPGGRRSVAVVSHDIDSIRKWTFRMRYRALTRGTRGTGEGRVRARLRHLLEIATDVGASRDPHHNLESLRGVERRAGVKASYFVQMSKGRNRREPFAQYSYRNRYLRGELARLRAEGHEIALHASYESADHPEAVTDEAQRLTFVTRPEGVRQHYLRSRPALWDTYRRAGMLYDSTVGYSEFVGFRTGSCHPYNVFDFSRSASTGILEIPFAVMDSALVAAAGVGKESMQGILTNLSTAISQREGVFVSIWHNQYLDGQLVQAGSALEDLFTLLHGEDWLFATMAEVANWWIRRQEVSLSHRGPSLWEIRSQQEVRDFAVRVAEPAELHVEGIPTTGWSVRRDRGERILVLHRLMPSDVVRVRVVPGKQR